MAQITETERLFVREFNMQDIESLQIILLNPEVMKYSFRNISSIKDIENYIENCLYNYKKYGFGQWAVVDKKSLQLIGVCGLNSGFNDDNNIMHINCRFAKPFWGKGFANEIVKKIIEYAQNQLKINKIYALIEPENLKSITLIKRLGFNYEKSSIYKKRKLDFYFRSLC